MIHDEIEAVYKVERCRAWIQHKSLTKVALQFPDHLLPDSAIVTARLQARVGAGVRLYILGDTTDGQCCVDEIAAEHVSAEADAWIQFGPTCLTAMCRLPALWINTRKVCDTSRPPAIRDKACDVSSPNNPRLGLLGSTPEDKNILSYLKILKNFNENEDIKYYRKVRSYNTIKALFSPDLLLRPYSTYSCQQKKDKSKSSAVPQMKDKIDDGSQQKKDGKKVEQQKKKSKRVIKIRPPSFYVNKPIYYKDGKSFVVTTDQKYP